MSCVHIMDSINFACITIQYFYWSFLYIFLGIWENGILRLASPVWCETAIPLIFTIIYGMVYVFHQTQWIYGITVLLSFYKENSFCDVPYIRKLFFVIGRSLVTHCNNSLINCTYIYICALWYECDLVQRGISLY